MTRRAPPRAGFTLIELILAVMLSAVVLIALNSLMLPLVRQEVLTARGQTASMSAGAALKTADLLISEASWIGAPTALGLPSDKLEGCLNALPPSATAAAAPLDPSRPMSWFALCPSKGLLYYHTGDGCPGSYSCGDRPAFSFGGGTSPSVKSNFTRASPYTAVVDIDLTMASGGATASVRSAAAYGAAAGTNQ